ncbi:MurR/RpiR family transcriptional regulator, partial [Luoshenia tenuis]
FSAKHIYILGLRSAAPLVQFFSYYLSFIFENITVVTSGVSDVFEQIFRAGEGDLLIGVSFPRYSSRTVEGINFAKKNGVKIVSITDSLLSPLASQADLCLVARSDMASFADSMVAAFSLVNALIVAIGSRKKDEISQYFTKLEAVWDEYSVYLGKDRNAN